MGLEGLKEGLRNVRKEQSVSYFLSHTYIHPESKAAAIKQVIMIIVKRIFFQLVSKIAPSSMKFALFAF